MVFRLAVWLLLLTQIKANSSFKNVPSRLILVRVLPATFDPFKGEMEIRRNAPTGSRYIRNSLLMEFISDAICLLLALLSFSRANLATR